MKKAFLIFLLTCLSLGAFILYRQALVQSTYNGLPTVPCIDTTRPIRQSFTFHISITIDNKLYPLDKSIGHDFGKCLHDIFIQDTSGTVYVQTNGNEQFTLGNFFDVWHKTYNKNQIFGYQANKGHVINVFVNGRGVETYEKTPILPSESIVIIYK